MGKNGGKKLKVSEAELEEMRETLHTDFGILVSNAMKDEALVALFKKASADAEKRRLAEESGLQLSSPTMPTASSLNEVNIVNHKSNAPTMPDDCWGVVLDFCGIHALYTACTACQQLRILADQAHLFRRFFFEIPQDVERAVAGQPVWRGWGVECKQVLGKFKGMDLGVNFVHRKAPRKEVDPFPGLFTDSDDDEGEKEDPNPVNLDALPWSQYWSLRLSLSQLECNVVITAGEKNSKEEKRSTESWKSVIAEVYKNDSKWWHDFVLKRRLSGDQGLKYNRRISHETKVAIEQLQKFKKFVLARSYLDLFHTVEEGTLLQEWVHIEANRHAGMHCIAEQLSQHFDFPAMAAAAAAAAASKDDGDARMSYGVPQGEEEIAEFISQLRQRSFDSDLLHEHDVVGEESYGFSKVKSRDYHAAAALADDDATSAAQQKLLGASTCGARTMRKRRQEFEARQQQNKKK